MTLAFLVFIAAPGGPRRGGRVRRQATRRGLAKQNRAALFRRRERRLDEKVGPMSELDAEMKAAIGAVVDELDGLSDEELTVKINDAMRNAPPELLAALLPKMHDGA